MSWKKNRAMNKLVSYIHKYREIISYLFWGALTTVVSWGSYGAFLFILNMVAPGLNAEIALANIFSWVCAVVFAFVTNKIFVFKSRIWGKEILIPEFSKFVSARLATGVLEIVFVPALVALGLDQSLFGVEGMVSKIIVSILVVIFNYIFSKSFIFKGDTGKNEKKKGSS